jgi:preprotein translocase subunit SecF
VTAILTVVGFSVHDTIVVFDRIRENLIVSSRLTFDQVVNLSIMQTAVRSMITSFTVVLVLIALLLFGGDTLRGFVLALLIGIVSGAYSSIFNASQLLVVWRRLQPVR